MQWLPEHTPASRRDRDRPRRLSDGQRADPSDAAAHRRRARLGTVDARPSAGRPRLRLHGLPLGLVHHRGARSTGSRRTSAFRPKREFIADYCRFAGRGAIENWKFYVVYNLFRSAAIIQGVYKRGLDGNASSDTAIGFKDACRMRSDRAWALVERSNSPSRASIRPFALKRRSCRPLFAASAGRRRGRCARCAVPRKQFTPGCSGGMPFSLLSSAAIRLLSSRRSSSTRTMDPAAIDVRDSRRNRRIRARLQDEPSRRDCGTHAIAGPFRTLSRTGR